MRKQKELSQSPIALPQSESAPRGGRLLFYYCAVFSLIITVSTFAYISRNNFTFPLIFLPVSLYFVFPILKKLFRGLAKKPESISDLYPPLLHRKLTVIFYFVALLAFSGWSIIGLTKADVVTSPSLVPTEAESSPEDVTTAISPNKLPGLVPEKKIEKKETVIIKTDNVGGTVNLRALPSTDSAVIGIVNDGDSFEVLSKKGGWIEIEIENGKRAWVDSYYTQKESGGNQ